MFDGIGAKIKNYAKVITGIGIVLSVLSGIVMAASLHFFLGIIIAAIGVLFSWISTFLLYGFGELVDNSEKIAKDTTEMANISKNFYYSQRKLDNLVDNSEKAAQNTTKIAKDTTEMAYISKKFYFAQKEKEKENEKNASAD